MKYKKVKLHHLSKVILIFINLFGALVVVGLLMVASFVAGYGRGVFRTTSTSGKNFSLVRLIMPQVITETTGEASPTPIVIVKNDPPKVQQASSWGGPDLWEAVNKKRSEYGVNPLNNKAELCTIAAIRLSEILELGKLDGHEGFSNMPDRREDLRYIFEQYTVSEFLLSGAQTPEEAVALWEDTLGHKKLLTGGEYVWGCIYAQAGFAVAITAY